MTQELPVVLAIAGLDPSGGAGIQADIQTLTALRCHCASVISTHTVQDSQQLHKSYPVTAEILDHQLRILEADFHFSAIKLGALGSAANAEVIAQCIQRIATTTPSIPVILDPVLKASSGGALGDEALLHSLLNEIIPRCTLVTPNEPELYELTGQTSTQHAAVKLAKLGPSVLVTGGHNRDIDNNTLNNKLVVGAHQPDKPKNWTIKLIEGEFRGTGCTFSSAIAAYMANGLSVAQAIENAQFFVSYTLENAYRVRSGQRIPLRIPPQNHN